MRKMSQPQKTKLETSQDFSFQVTSDISTQKNDAQKVTENIQKSSLEKRKKEAKKPLYLHRV
jgi:hypothetical protein